MTSAHDSAPAELAGADVDVLLREVPGLTRDDLDVLLADIARRKASSSPDDPVGFISAREFYREAVQREDIRRILAALAK